MVLCPLCPHGVQLICCEVRNTVSSRLPSRNWDRIWESVHCSAVSTEEGQWLGFCSPCISCCWCVCGCCQSPAPGSKTFICFTPHCRDTAHQYVQCFLTPCAWLEDVTRSQEVSARHGRDRSGGGHPCHQSMSRCKKVHHNSGS